MDSRPAAHLVEGAQRLPLAGRVNWRPRRRLTRPRLCEPREAQYGPLGRLASSREWPLGRREAAAEGQRRPIHQARRAERRVEHLAKLIQVARLPELVRAIGGDAASDPDRRVDASSHGGRLRARRPECKQTGEHTFPIKAARSLQPLRLDRLPVAHCLAGKSFKSSRFAARLLCARPR